VPVVEIEALLYKHPSWPPQRSSGYPISGSASAAARVSRCVPGASSRSRPSGYMAECKVAKQYWPERVEILPDLPRTPSGKIQKFKLRELVAGGLRARLRMTPLPHLDLEPQGDGIALLRLNRPESLTR